MKKYARYRIGLLIGLLSLNTLSACVNIRQELGWWPSRAWLTKVTMLLSSPLQMQFNSLKSESNRLSAMSVNKGSSLIIHALLPTGEQTNTTPNMNITNSNFIIQAIQKGSEEWSTNGTTSTINVTQLDHTTQGNPADDGAVITVRDPMVLDDPIMNDLKGNGFWVASIEYWLAKGLNIDAKDNKLGYTLLMHAVFDRRECAFRFLLDKGANVNAQDNDGNTPLHLAVAIDHAGLVNCLVQANNINVNARDGGRNTALHLAIKLGHVDVANRLIQAKNIDLDIKGEDNRTPLHCAAQRDYSGLVQALLASKNNIDVNAKDKYEDTALHLAAASGRVAVVNLLLQAENIDVNAKDLYNRTALHVAAESGYLDIVQAFVETKSIDPLQRDQFGKAAFRLANGNNHKDVIDYLFGLGYHQSS